MGEQATPFGRTIGGSVACKCRWCKAAFEYLLVGRLRIYVCPVCDNRPPSAPMRTTHPPSPLVA